MSSLNKWFVAASVFCCTDQSWEKKGSSTTSAMQ